MFYNFFSWLESLFATPATTALEDAILGLADAEKQALTEKSMADYAAAEVICHNAMADYQRKRSQRLAAYIKEQEATLLTYSDQDNDALVKRI